MLRYCKLIPLLIFLHCFPTPKVAGQFTDQEFERMADQMAEGGTPNMSIETLREQRQNVILLDTRARAEYDVSHIPGARWVGYDDFTPERVADLSRDTTVVVYCSVGYRSERIGEKLRDAGFSRVYNLHGSIFKWVNLGYPITDDQGRRTNRIHGYDAKWSKWLRRGEVVY
jgi:rhodanese-related sulfurtransferase